MDKENNTQDINATGKRIKIERKKLRYTSKEIAKNIGVTPASVFYIENRSDDNAYIKYLVFLRKNGIDLNKIFDFSDELT